MLLDEALPSWDRRTVHRIATDSPPPALLSAVQAVTWREVPVFRALLTIRGLGRGGLAPDAPILDWFASNGFRQVGRTDDELLVVAVQPLRGRDEPQTPPDLDTFREHREPRSIKIATNFRTADGFLVTETRVLGTDARSRRLFAAYWLVIRAGSGLIRRVWLRAIRSRAAASTNGGGSGDSALGT